jgi:hypothetical protein
MSNKNLPPDPEWLASEVGEYWDKRADSGGLTVPDELQLDVDTGEVVDYVLAHGGMVRHHQLPTFNGILTRGLRELDAIMAVLARPVQDMESVTAKQQRSLEEARSLVAAAMAHLIQARQP